MLKSFSWKVSDVEVSHDQHWCEEKIFLTIALSIVNPITDHRCISIDLRINKFVGICGFPMVAAKTYKKHM